MLKTCDCRRVVLLSATDPLPPNVTGALGSAAVTEYRPNRVTVRLTDARGGFLVTSDVCFPGWVCRVDGKTIPIYRANHAFRAVAISPGANEVVFTFEPYAYHLGWRVSVGAVGLLLAASLLRLVLRQAFGRGPAADASGV